MAEDIFTLVVRLKLSPELSVTELYLKASFGEMVIMGWGGGWVGRAPCDIKNLILESSHPRANSWTTQL